jgi:hypothetical protein
MTTLKTTMLAIALFAGGSSLAIAQNRPPTGGQPPVANPGPPGPGVNPAPNLNAAPPTGAASGTRITHRTTHHMYMSGSHHKTLKTGQPLPKQPQ